MNSRAIRRLGLVASLSVAASMCAAVPVFAEDIGIVVTVPQQGPTVVADPDSPTGYTTTFVYHNPNATQVRLAGDLTLLDLTTGNTRYQPEDWQTGRYHTGGTEFLRDMTMDEDGNWSVSIPTHAGALSYWYRVWDPTQEWDNKRIWDPASTKLRPAGDSFRVRNNDVLDAVYVPYDAKQNDPVLQARAAYELPAADPTARGSVAYIEYTTILGDGGHYLGIYLPPGYDPDRAEPYKVAYLAHGIFGDETDWLVPGSAGNILDNMIAKGEIEPTVLVTVGNHFTGTGLGFGTYDRQNAANNLVQNVLPLIETNYNVSDKPEDRAYAGFSYGGMTSGFIMNSFPTTFGYFGQFSGNPSLTAEQYDAFAAAVAGQEPMIFLGNGRFEGNLNATNTIAENFKTRGIPAETTQVNGAHDMMTAGQLFTIYARDYLWQNSAPSQVLSVRNITDMGSFGQQVVAVVLEYAETVDASKLSVEDFSVQDTAYNFRFDNISTLNDLEDCVIADVYTTSDPALLLEEERPEGEGRFVVLQLAPSLETGWTTITVPSNTRFVMVNPNQPTEVTQIGDVYNTAGTVISGGNPAEVFKPTLTPINRQVDQFVHGLLAAPAVGQPLNYDYRLPANYDPTKKYPLVVALPGQGQGYDGANNLRVHLTTDMLAPAWASYEWIGRDEDVIVLAPQNARVGGADVQGAQTVQLIEQFSAEFSVDTRRVYATSISYGSTLMWWMFANRPDIFAGGLMTGGFANNAAQAVAIAAAEVPMWITHGVGDHLLAVANSRASYQRIVSAYKARGFSDEAVAELVHWTEYGDDAFTLLDRHLASAPTLEDPTKLQWLLDQRQSLRVSATVSTRCVAGKAMPTVTVTNQDSVAATVTITSAFGTKTLSVPAGKSGFHAFTTRLATMPAAAMSIQATDASASGTATKSIALSYAAQVCG